MKNLPLRRILLIEHAVDDAMLITTMVEDLLEEGGIVHHVRSLESGLRSLTEEDFDVILLDIALPDSRGAHAVSELNRVDPSIPIIVLTRPENDAASIEAMQLGAEDFLVKGAIGPDTLARSLRYARERKRLASQQRDLENQILNVLNDEQIRIGQELHDGIGQALSGLAMLARTLTRQLEDTSADHAQSAATIADGLQRTLRELRQIMRGLNPLELESYGLPDALRRHCERVQEASQIDIRFHCDVDAAELTSEAATHVYRIVQEALSNAIRHGQARKISVWLVRRGQRYILQIVDNGQGFDTSSTHDGFGLRIMAYRVSLLRGKLEIQSDVGKGTVIKCSLPTDAARGQQEAPVSPSNAESF